MSRRDDSMTIGLLARKAGVNVETVRYYQRLGLVREPPRPAQGYRRYPHSDVARIRFIREAQQLGFSLREVGELLALNDSGCGEARRMAEHKREQIAARIEALRHMHDTLDEMIGACRRSERQGTSCALIESLAARSKSV